MQSRGIFGPHIRLCYIIIVVAWFWGRHWMNKQPIEYSYITWRLILCFRTNGESRYDVRRQRMRSRQIVRIIKWSAINAAHKAQAHRKKSKTNWASMNKCRRSSNATLLGRWHNIISFRNWSTENYFCKKLLFSIECEVRKIWHDFALEVSWAMKRNSYRCIGYELKLRYRGIEW